MNTSSMAMEIDAPTGKRSRSRSPDKAELTRKKTAREETVKAPPILLTTEMMMDKSPDRPATPSGGRPRSNALRDWTPVPSPTRLQSATSDCTKPIMAGL
ncbi:hypothetical protein PFICI_03129 [Pestalotiopsis fici W106-1]|uniref:Uncharacterized protein n=1 Tax=Pestalotiopsis fici (strain W106-1 / CGMCC3.15140) TaxID=1229662 RepID=W3XGG7_PESFW|nr:uncharacterized protein PFICI_03129 [Pestalotiopsis fici W106-1]ETS85104.1 hypothetical protein PFICI_03129 [Pestalotiopsis fici W106-1]